MSRIVDARGLSCPQPVMLTLEEITGARTGRIEVQVDTKTSMENVARAAETQGWQVAEVQPEDAGYRLVITRE